MPERYLSASPGFQIKQEQSSKSLLFLLTLGVILFTKILAQIFLVTVVLENIFPKISNVTF